MGKRTLFTTVTPLPAHIPRALAIEMLHNHTEMIELNPLVIAHRPIEAPKNAPADEFFAIWHEMTDKVHYTPGGFISSKVSYKGVFHDMPWGLQTHIYAPLGLEIRDKWQIRGNQPGEPREVRELGVDAPHDGLYLREDVDMTCNRIMSGFVKKQLVTAHAVLVERLMKKAELIDSGALQAMMENGRLKTINPAVRNAMAASSPRNSQQPPLSPGFSQHGSFSHHRSLSQHGSLSQHRPSSPQMLSPPQMLSSQQSYHDPHSLNHPAFRTQEEKNMQSAMSLPPYQAQGTYVNDMAKNPERFSAHVEAGLGVSHAFTAELPGSTYQTAPYSPGLARPMDRNIDRTSIATELSAQPSIHRTYGSPHIGNTNDTSSRSSVASDLPGSINVRGMPSPLFTPDRQSQVSEISTPPISKPRTNSKHGYEV